MGTFTVSYGAMRWNHFTRTLGINVVGICCISAFTPVWNSAGRAMSPPADIRPAAAIVVLAAGMSGANILGDESLRRTTEGVRLYQRGLAPLIVLSGSGAEADVRARFARDIGIPLDAIVRENTANTTREEAVRVAGLLQPRGAMHILLVTESMHMRRAKRVFERAGFDVSVAPSDEYPAAVFTPEDRLWLMMRVSQESAAFLYYSLAGYF
jgi:uncharacterized SAM-binding protein YcdF (DUF218 family)